MTTTPSGEGWTPGPWRVVKRSGMARAHYGDCVTADFYSKPGVSDGRDSVCDCRGDHGHANACLIAAAPALYAACKALVGFSTEKFSSSDEMVARIMGVVEQARAALTLATQGDRK